MPVVSLPLFRCSKPKEICRWRNKGPALLSEFGCRPLRHGPPDSAERARRTRQIWPKPVTPAASTVAGTKMPSQNVGLVRSFVSP